MEFPESVGLARVHLAVRPSPEPEDRRPQHAPDERRVLVQPGIAGAQQQRWRIREAGSLGRRRQGAAPLVSARRADPVGPDRLLADRPMSSGMASLPDPMARGRPEPRLGLPGTADVPVGRLRVDRRVAWTRCFGGGRRLAGADRSVARARSRLDRPGRLAFARADHHPPTGGYSSLCVHRPPNAGPGPRPLEAAGFKTV